MRCLCIPRIRGEKRLPNIAKAAKFATHYENLCYREDKYLLDELTDPLRLALDKIVFDILGLTSPERASVYNAVTNLIESRLKKAESLRG